MDFKATGKVTNGIPWQFAGGMDFIVTILLLILLLNITMEAAVVTKVILVAEVAIVTDVVASEETDSYASSFLSGYH